MTRHFVLCASVLAAAMFLQAQTPSGEAIYKQRCSACHDQAGSRIPPRASLQKMPALRILRAMNSGAMMTVAYPLRREERDAVARYLGTPGPEPGPKPEAFCKVRTISLKQMSTFSWNGWSPAPDNARFQSAHAASLSISQVRKLKLKWAFGLDGDISAYAQPTVVDGHIFMGSAAGVVYALDASNGCIEWTYQADAPVREAVSTAPVGDRHAVLFGDLTGTFYAVEAESGRPLWKKRIEEHEAALLTGSPTVYQDNVYIGVAPGRKHAPSTPRTPAAVSAEAWWHCACAMERRFGKLIPSTTRRILQAKPRPELYGKARRARASGRRPRSILCATCFTSPPATTTRLPPLLPATRS